MTHNPSSIRTLIHHSRPRQFRLLRTAPVFNNTPRHLYSHPAKMTDPTPKDDLKITLHWLSSSRSHRIAWLLEELSLPYTLKTYARQPSMLAPPELRAIHPLGKSPVLTIETPSLARPLVLAESGNIVEYLLDHFGQALVPARWKPGCEGRVGGETDEWLRYRYFMHYTEGSLMTPLVLGLVMTQLKGSAVPFFVRPISRAIAGQVESTFLRAEVANHWDFVEGQLESSPGRFLAGDTMTGADVLMVFPLDAGEGFYGLDRDKRPKLLEYRDMLMGREAYKRATERVEEETGGEMTVGAMKRG